MNRQTSPPPQLLADNTQQADLSKKGIAGLDERIRMTELRLVKREEHMQQRLHQLTQEVDHATRHRHLLLPVGGAILGMAALALFRGRRRPGGVQLSKAVARSPGQGAGWVRLLGLGWPLMPASVRSRVNPATVSTVLAVGLPLVEGWMAQRRGLAAEAASPLVTMPRVDLDRYAGHWYEVARLPVPFEHRCAGQPTATYRALEPNTDGTVLDIVNRCPAPNGEMQEARGVARLVPGSGGARLKVNLLPEWLQWLGALPFAWADYWILHVDEGYTEALVGDPQRKHLWVLARDPAPPPERIQALIERARQQGFPVERLVFPDPA
jgi:apolipoprotein D and lipocalin family protein